MTVNLGKTQRWARRLNAVERAAMKLATRGARVWTCDHCNKRETWRKGWAWYVGVESRANPGFPWVTCSKGCAMATNYGLEPSP